MVLAEVPLWVIHSSNQDLSLDRPATVLNLLQGRKAAIYSVDFHPDGSIFATAGGDGTAKIWSTQTLFTKKGGKFNKDTEYESSDDEDMAGEASEMEDNEQNNGLQPVINDLSGFVRKKKGNKTVASPQSTPSKAVNKTSPTSKSTKQHKKLIATLSSHTGSSVLAVRFSNNGKYLASAGDDGIVCIYKALPNSEQWTRIRLLQGHGLDVVDLAWSPDDSHLVSCSLDSETPIVVWKTDGLEREGPNRIQPFKILGKKEHTSNVKGIAFDPAGSYMASSGDDPAVCIWRAHDDWGLEKRIDSKDGIFRKWNENDSGATLSHQSLFRRISWSTDGKFVLSTNSVNKNKHVACTITRQGWSTDPSKPGAASLVGHKQSVVVSRHAPKLLLRQSDDDAAEHSDVPDYANLLAIGDKRGYITVWTTRDPRPLFRLQCSESRSTVTDLAWGSRSDGNVVLLVSLLEGQLVALRFSVPDEVGKFLSNADQSRVFKSQYGFDLDESGKPAHGSRLFNSGNRAPKFIENTLQLTMEDEIDESMEIDDVPVDTAQENRSSVDSIRMSQKETVGNGKRRIQPFSMDDTGKKSKTTTYKAPPTSTQNSAATDSGKQGETTQAPTSPNPIRSPPRANFRRETSHSAQRFILPLSQATTHSNEHVFHDGDSTGYIVRIECRNGNKAPIGSQGSIISVADLSLAVNGRITWVDQLPGTSCSCLVSSTHFLAVGTSDGALQLYGTSPSTGLKCGSCFRAQPLLILGSPVVSMNLSEHEKAEDTKLVVLCADGTFYVFSFELRLKLCYKGSVAPALSNLSLSLIASEHTQPSFSKIQMTENRQLLLLASLSNTRGQTEGSLSSKENSPSGSMHAFLYDELSECWLKVSDSRFILSDFYRLPSSQKMDNSSELSKLDEKVQLGSSGSFLKPMPRKSAESGALLENMDDEGSTYVPTRSHCEDRIACSIALQSQKDFCFWLGLYARILSIHGQANELRMIVDILLKAKETDSCEVSPGERLVRAFNSFDLDGKQVVKDHIIPEMSKNRSLQRMTNEILLEVQI